MSVGWDDDSAVASWSGLPPLDGDRTADACVVGLGGSGLSAVAALAERGLSVIGVDAGRVAAGASGRNGGFLLGGSALFLHDTLARLGDDAADGLYRETVRELDRLEAVLGPDVIRRVGSIRLAGLPGEPTSAAEAEDRAREVTDVAAHAAALRAHSIAVEDYAGPLGTGIYLPQDAAMNPARSALGLASTLSADATLHEHTPATRIEAGRVSTQRGVICAGVVIVAVDGRLEVLLPQLAGHVRTARLQMLATAPLHPGRLTCPVYGRWGYDYAQQTQDGRLFVGGGRDLVLEDEWTIDQSTTSQVQHYLDGLAERMAGARVEVTHRWAASVGYTPDGRPLCVQVAEGVIAVGGYNGTGNLVGPVAARAAVALALDGTAPLEAFVSTVAPPSR